jgi:SAM-dependent methyltransferase
MSLYDNNFYLWVNDTASKSANELLPILKNYIRPTSVLDVGCGRGAWLRVWKRLGVNKVLGVDGDYVLNDQLLINDDEFVPADLTIALPVTGRFDLVQCFEVAEHLDPSTSLSFIGRITSHSDFVIFSAAQPGQGGENHINERVPSYWAKLFLDNGFECFDFIRPLISKNEEISKWYKYNVMLFVRSSRVSEFENTFQVTRVLDFSNLDSVRGDWLWELKRLILRWLPVGVVTTLSKFNYQYLKRG